MSGSALTLSVTPSLSLTVARAEALAVSPVCRADHLDRAAADAAIRASVRAHGGTRGCAAALAQAFGDHPETAGPRMRWARHTVESLYGLAR
ncbi:MAG TPA: hypothetical protein VLJ59_11550 [Mycobacteriales bacterium]|nr:hypothetical protein [Mycobacteriales bacterium]